MKEVKDSHHSLYLPRSSLFNSVSSRKRRPEGRVPWEISRAGSVSNNAMIYGFITASMERDPRMYLYTTSQPPVMDALSNVALVVTLKS